MVMRRINKSSIMIRLGRLWLSGGRSEVGRMRFGDGMVLDNFNRGIGRSRSRSREFSHMTVSSNGGGSGEGGKLVVGDGELEGESEGRGPQRGDRVYVAMSGGVDSTVTAYLMKQKGIPVIGIYMRNWDPKEEGINHDTPCEAEWRKVQFICQQLDIPCQRLDFVKEYWSQVFLTTLDSYQSGETPNPDLLCNREIKFHRLLHQLRQQTSTLPGGGKVWLATGHYARLRRDTETGELQLYRGVDPIKDQTYYLASLRASQLEEVLFPLGGYLKSEVKELARKIGLETVADQPESMGICFVGKRKKFSEFLGRYLTDRPGTIVTDQGEKLGHHQGLWSHTLGQRVRLSHHGSSRWFVVTKRHLTNELIVVNDRHHPALYATHAYLPNFHWLNSPPTSPLLTPTGHLLYAKVRSTQPPTPVHVTLLHPNGTLHIQFVHPIWALAPGQYIVLYTAAHRCLGAGPVPTNYRQPPPPSIPPPL